MAPKKPAVAKKRGRPSISSLASSSEAMASPAAATKIRKVGEAGLTGESALRLKQMKVQLKMMTGTHMPHEMNVEYNARLSDALTLILSHEKFHNIFMTDPDNTFKAPYDGDHRAKAMQHGTYECALNVFWLNMFWAPDANVPRSFQRMLNLMDTLLPGSAPTHVFPKTVVVALRSAEDDPMESRGALRVLSPLEVLHTLIFKVGQAIEAGCSDTDLDAWRRCMLSVSVRFVVAADGDELHFMAINLRDQQVGAGMELERTCAQRIFEVIDFKVKREKVQGKMSVLDVVKAYTTHARLAKTTEKVTNGFLEMAMSVWSRLFSSKTARDVVLAMDDSHGTASPFNAIAVLQLIVHRCKTPDVIEWAVCHIADEINAGLRPASDFTVSFLKGKTKDWIAVVTLLQNECAMNCVLFH